jgi:hypothetical protein
MAGCSAFVDDDLGYLDGWLPPPTTAPTRLAFDHLPRARGVAPPPPARPAIFLEPEAFIRHAAYRRLTA